MVAALSLLLPSILNSGEGIGEELALKLGDLLGPDLLSVLALSNQLRRHFCGTEIALCAIVNAKSGRCPEDCAYCAQSISYDTGVETFPLISVDELAARVQAAAACEVDNFSIVTSGTAVECATEQEQIVAMLQEIAATGVAPCASLGFLDHASARRYCEAGLKHYHHNLETSRSFFAQICTTHDYDRAIATVQTAKAAGLYVCSGGIMGLGESWAQRVELALTLRVLKVDSIPLNFLLPVRGTPLENQAGLSPMEALLTIAMFRFVCPTVDIRICGGRQRTFADFQSLLFAAGANGLMVGNYLTTSGRQWADDKLLLADWKLFDQEAVVR
ncbi:biotin synthase BioB [bacterium]|nr:biotin synthase BioB [bacterium]